MAPILQAISSTHKFFKILPNGHTDLRVLQAEVYESAAVEQEAAEIKTPLINAHLHRPERFPMHS